MVAGINKFNGSRMVLLLTGDPRPAGGEVAKAAALAVSHHHSWVRSGMLRHYGSRCVAILLLCIRTV